MTKLSPTPPPFVGFLSPWKTPGMMLLLLALAVCPLLPNFGDGLRHTVIFYTKGGYPLLVAACSVLFLISLALLPLVIRALLMRPAIEISADSVRVWCGKWREYPLNSMSDRVRRQFGNLLVRCPDGKQFTIPLWLYRRPHEVLMHLTGDRTSTPVPAAS